MGKQMREQLFRIMNAVARELYPLLCKCDPLNASDLTGFTLMVYSAKGDQLLFSVRISNNECIGIEDVSEITKRILAAGHSFNLTKADTGHAALNQQVRER